MKLRLASVSLLLLAAWAFAFGPLFAWSPVHPGYDTQRLQRATIVYPASTLPAAALTGADAAVADVESWLGMTMHSRVTVVLCRDWDDFHRFVPTIRGRVGGVTIGSAIYLTPRIAEKHLDLGEYLRHELTHALVGQNVPLWRLPRLEKRSWLYEGVPVWVGRQQSYATHQEFLAQARTLDLAGVIDTAHPSSDMRFNYVAWRNFIDYLDHTHGRAAFLDFYHAYLADPDAELARFQSIFGASLPDAVRHYQSTLR